MSLTKRGKTFYYDFKYRGRRFRGPTGQKAERAARAVERQKREEAKKEIERREALGRSPLTWAVASSRYWLECGQFHKPATKTLPALAWLTRHIGEATPLSAINGDMVARLVARRRADGVQAGTVNRRIEALRRVLLRAKLWGETVAFIEWRKYLLKEPSGRVRELRADEEAALFRELRGDFHPIVKFALLTGCRRAECVNLAWHDIDWGNRKIWIDGKGGRRDSIPISDALRELLFPLQAHHAEKVFTHIVHRASNTTRRGERVPIAYEGLVTEFVRARQRAGLRDFRFHDLRHSAATRMLRATGNLVVTSRLLRHSSIRMTSRYAHSTHDDVLAAMEATNPLHRLPASGTPTELLNKAKGHG